MIVYTSPCFEGRLYMKTPETPLDLVRSPVFAHSYCCSLFMQIRDVVFRSCSKRLTFLGRHVKLGFLVPAIFRLGEEVQYKLRQLPGNGESAGCWEVGHSLVESPSAFKDGV